MRFWSGHFCPLAKNQFQFQFPDSDLVTRFQDDFAMQRLAVYAGTVGTSQIAKANRVFVDTEDAVVATDEIAVGA